MTPSPWIGPEIGEGYERGGIMVVGRDPGAAEVREGRPFVGPAGELLERCLTAAGMRRKDVAIANVVGRRPPGNNFARHSRSDVARGRRELGALLQRSSPHLVIALGNEAAYTFLPSQWPTRTGDVFGAYGILERRGYLWESEEHDCWVLTAVHPAALLHGGGSQTFGSNAVIGEMLLTWDLERAKEFAAREPIERRQRNVTVVHDAASAEIAGRRIRAASGVVAADIEIFDEQSLACVGFAPTEAEAYVFTSRAFGDAFELLRDPAVPLCFQNSPFDLYFLRSRCGVIVQGLTDDSIVAWHCFMPEMAGAAQKGGKRTEKSLRFLASLYTDVAWWKDYEFEDHAAMYRLNGLDCCVTLEVLRKIKAGMREAGIDERIYRHEMRLIEPVVRILERGIKVDEERRQRALRMLEEQRAGAERALGAFVRPVLEERREHLDKPHLIWTTTTCPCCRGGSAKAVACWSCAGFEASPSKGELEERFGNPGGLLKAELEAEVLGPCEECEGEGRWESFSFNAGSDDQVRDLLYRALGLRERYLNGRPTVNESALKGLLSTVEGDAAEIIQLILRRAKLSTMRSIYERVAPGLDGRIRTALSPVATETGRFGSSATFLEPGSTNLQNIPKKAAHGEPLFDVRSVLVPDPGHVLVEADLSQAEARATAAYARDERTLEIFASGRDIHKVTAAAIFGVEPDEVSKEQRFLGKMARHALNYGMGAKTFRSAINDDADLTGITLTAAEAKRIWSTYRVKNPELVRWWQEIEERVRSVGWLENCYGRKRIFLDRSSRAMGSAIAYLPQSTIADHLNHLLAEVYEQLDPQLLQIVLQVHDSIIALVPIDGWKSAARRMRDVMDQPIEINGYEVPLPVDVSVSSKSWAEVEEVRL